MIFNIDKNVFIVIVSQVLIAVTLFCKKTPQLFNSDGSIKSYGTGKDQTLYPVFLVILIPSIVLYVLLVTKNNEFI